MCYSNVLLLILFKFSVLDLANKLKEVFSKNCDKIFQNRNSWGCERNSSKSRKRAVKIFWELRPQTLQCLDLFLQYALVSFYQLVSIDSFKI